MAHDARFVQSGGHTIRVITEGAGPLVLMVHGWPESWYSWRHQIGPIAQAGYTAAAMDVRGYGGSSKPRPVQAYDMKSLISDVRAVADALGGGKAILIGHDWGAPIVWNSALVDPDRFPAVAGLAIPYSGLGEEPFIDSQRRKQAASGRFFYQLYMQDEGVAEAELEADVRGGLRKIYHALSGEAPDDGWPKDKLPGDTLLHRLINPKAFPSWLTADDIDYLVKEFEGSGFRGPLNRYRNFHRDFEWLGRFGHGTIQQPALFVAGEKDMAFKLFGRHAEERMRSLMPNLCGYHVLPGCGHWTQQERPAEVTGLLLGWLQELRSRATTPAVIPKPAKRA